MKSDKIGKRKPRGKYVLAIIDGTIYSTNDFALYSLMTRDNL